MTISMACAAMAAALRVAKGARVALRRGRHEGPTMANQIQGTMKICHRLRNIALQAFLRTNGISSSIKIGSMIPMGRNKFY